MSRLAPRKDASGAYLGLDHFHSFSPLDFFSREEMDPVFQTIVPEAIAKVLDEAVSVGVTAMEDVQFYRNFAPYVLEYRKRGIFDKVRLRGAFYVDAHDLKDQAQPKESLAWWKEMDKESDQRLTLGLSIKFYIDGTPGNRTSFLLEPYEDDPDHYGRPDWTAVEFNQVIELLDDMRLQSLTHANR